MNKKDENAIILDGERYEFQRKAFYYCCDECDFRPHCKAEDHRLGGRAVKTYNAACDIFGQGILFKRGGETGAEEKEKKEASA